MKVYFLLPILFMVGCAHSNTNHFERQPATDLNSQQRMPYAQYLAHIRPKIEIRLSEPEIITRIGAPAPKDPKNFMTKLSALLSLKPVPDNLLITESDFDLSHPEKVALFKVKVNEDETVSITAPLIDGKVPDPSTRQNFGPDEDSHGNKLEGMSVDDVARAVLELPKMTRVLIKEIDLHTHRNPTDQIFKVAYSRPTFRAYMAANTFPIGVVGVFPQPHADGVDDQPDALDMANTIAHELGHAWTYGCFGMNLGLAGSKWLEWNHAISSDKVWVSDYAASSIIEDTAESALVYAAVKSWDKTSTGKDLQSKMEQMIPARWELLKRWYPSCGR